MFKEECSLRAFYLSEIAGVVVTAAHDSAVDGAAAASIAGVAGIFWSCYSVIYSFSQNHYTRITTLSRTTINTQDRLIDTFQYKQTGL